MEKAVAEHLVEKGCGGLAQQIVDRSDRRRAAPRGRRCGSPVIRSSVSTVRPVRSQSTRGTRKSGSPAKFSASSEAAAASKRRSISNLTDLGQRLHDLDRLQPAQRGLQPLAQTGQPQEQVEIAGKRRGDARPQHLDRDLVPVGRPREMDLGDRGGRDRRSRRTMRTALSSGRANSASISARASLPGTAAAGPAGSPDRAVISSPRRSARVDRSWPSLMKLGPSSLERGGEPLTRARRDRAAAARKQAAEPQKGRRGRDGRPTETARRAARGSGRSGPAGQGCGRCAEARTRVGAGQRRQAEWSAATPPVRLRNLHLVEPGARRSSRRARSAAGSGGCFRRDRRRRRGRR